jgi:hypothetical protein
MQGTERKGMLNLRVRSLSVSCCAFYSSSFYALPNVLTSASRISTSRLEGMERIPLLDRPAEPTGAAGKWGLIF